MNKIVLYAWLLSFFQNINYDKIFLPVSNFQLKFFHFFILVMRTSDSKDVWAMEKHPSQRMLVGLQEMEHLVFSNSVTVLFVSIVVSSEINQSHYFWSNLHEMRQRMCFTSSRIL